MSSTGAGSSTDRRREPAELALDLALAATLIGGAIRQGSRALEEGVATVSGAAALGAALLPTLVAGALVAAREPAREAGPGAVAAALPSLALPLSLPLWVASPASWPMANLLAFVIGAAITCASLAALGRSFAVLPARRTVVERGPYRLVRHPVYAGELIMWGAACATLSPLVALGLAIAGAGAIALRIRAEERVLEADPAYRAYATRVPGRLLPASRRAPCSPA